jgi:hypothetical protein
MRQVVPFLLAALLTVPATLSLPVSAADPMPAEAAIPEPKEAEIQRLYRQRIEWINQGSVKFLGEEGARKVLINFDTLKKTGCESPEKGVFNCAVLVDSAVGLARIDTRRLTLTLIKDGDDWRLR